MNYIKGFDSLRAISILLVLLTHLGLYNHLPANDFMHLRVWPLISGLTGVQIFFALSGFLITNILLREKITTGSIRFKFFYIKRFIRLLPPLIVFYCIIIFCMWFGLLPWNKTGLLLSVFYLYNFTPNYLYSSELGHTWSLAVEEQFYFIWPFVLAVFNSISIWIIIISTIIILCIVGIYILPSATIVIHNSHLYGSNFKTERWFIPASAPIMIGSLFAIMINYFHASIKNLLQFKTNRLIIPFILFFTPLFLPYSLLPVASIFQGTGIAFFLTWVYFNQSSKIVSLLNNPLMSYIGKISYGIYVYQGFFLRTGPGNGDGLWVQKAPVNIILTFLVAILSYELMEKRCLKYKKHFQ